MWNYNGISTERVKLLAVPFVFDELIEEIRSELQVVSYTPEPAVHLESGVWRPVFLARVPGTTFDRFFNSCCGYRGQYWEDPQTGMERNGKLLNRILEVLMPHAPQVVEKQRSIAYSLVSKHAKIWIDESDEASSIQLDDKSLIVELAVDRWVESARDARARLNNGEDSDGKLKLFERVLGVRAPTGTRLVVMGDWLNSAGVRGPALSKLNRAQEIHSYGFT